MRVSKFTRPGFFLIALTMIAGMIISGFGYNPQAQAQGGPTATPETPEWLAFSVARDALSEKIQRQITWVQTWTYNGDANFENGMDDCRVPAEDEAPIPEVFFGWQFIITLLNREQYEVRVSYNREIIVICDEVTVDVAAPEQTTGGVTGSVAPAGPGGLEVGAQMQVGASQASEYTQLKGAGMKWVKKQVTPANYGAAAGYITEAHANGMKILLSVVGDHATATTAAGQDAFAAKVAEFAAAGADAIEVWNEANLDREWPHGQISGASYAQLLAKAYNAINAANGNTIVILGAPAPTGAAGNITSCSQNASFCNDDVWYREVAAAGGGNVADCIGVHYNEGIVSPTQSSGDPRDNYPTRYYGSNLARALAPFPGKQACITEIGYLTAEGYGTLPGGFAWAADTSVAEHAQWLGQAVDIAQAQGNVRLLIVFNYNLNTVAWGSDPQAGYAMIRANGSCPACDTIKAALSS